VVAGARAGGCGDCPGRGRAISDPFGVEGGGEHTGLGLLPVATVFAAEKVLARPARTAYEIHHGVVTVTAEAADFPGGCRVGNTWGTIWHGLLDDDAARHAFLTQVAELTGKPAPDGTVSFAALRESRLDRLADAIAAHVDTGALMKLIEGGPTAPPFIPPGAPKTV
jgi:adenosylcobyric acid synthase